MARLVRHHDHIVRAGAVALAAGLALHGGAGRAQAQVPTRLAYSANVDGSVGIFSVSPTTGALAALGSVQSSGDPTAIAVDPSGRFVYVARSDENIVSAYGIDSAAGLTFVGSVAANNPVSLAFEPSGRFLYAADAGGESTRSASGRTGRSRSSPEPTPARVPGPWPSTHPDGSCTASILFQPVSSPIAWTPALAASRLSAPPPRVHPIPSR